MKMKDDPKAKIQNEQAVKALPNKLFLLFTLMLSLNFILADRAAADGQFHFIVGYVRDVDGNPIVGLDVLGDDYVGDDLQSWPTDENGYYRIDAITDGNYRVIVSCEQLTARGFLCLEPVSVSVAAELTDQDFTVFAAAASLQITNAFLPNGNVGVEYNAPLGATGGSTPYEWQLAADSASLPAGLTLDANGLISGTPTAFSAASVKVQVTDAESVVADKVLSIIINPKPVLSAPVWLTNRFSMRLSGAPNQNYTIQAANGPNSTNWTSILVTNNPNVGSFIVRDPNATNRERFYRVLIGP